MNLEEMYRELSEAFPMLELLGDIHSEMRDISPSLTDYDAYMMAWKEVSDFYDPVIWSSYHWFQVSPDHCHISIGLLEKAGKVRKVLENVMVWAGPYDSKLGEKLNDRLHKFVKFDDSE